MLSLSNSPIGKEQTVTWIAGNRAEQESIRSTGITEGCSLRVIGSFFGSVIVALAENRFALDNMLASCIKVSA